MKYYLIAGEASGDMHGAALMSALQKADSNADFRYWGGSEMEKISGNLVKHYKDTSFMGFVEVLKNLPTILRLFSFCKKDIQAYAPDKIIFIDYPGFNLRMAKWAKKNGYETIYYIAPQVWAWKESRIKQIKKYIDELYVILPFEKKYFKKHGIDAKYFGHPLAHKVQQQLDKKQLITDIPKGCIACFPGSRAQEIKAHLAVIIAVSKQFTHLHFCVAGVRSVNSAIYDNIDSRNITVYYDRNYDILSNAKLAIISSGTATLEACLFNIPQVVIYKGNSLSYIIAKQLIKIKYISLVNLLVDKQVVTELIQNELTPKNLKRELINLMNLDAASRQLHYYNEIRNQLGEENPSKYIAESIVKK